MEDVDALLSKLDIEPVSVRVSKLNTSSEDHSSSSLTPDSSLATAASGGKQDAATKAEEVAKYVINRTEDYILY